MWEFILSQLGSGIKGTLSLVDITRSHRDISTTVDTNELHIHWTQSPLVT